jgi:molybdate/tungstate transport system substrate-binding protein
MINSIPNTPALCRGVSRILPLLLLLGATFAGSSDAAHASGGTVNVYYAASLKALNETSVGPQFASADGYTYQGFPLNSGLIVNEIKAGTIHPDVVEFADASLNSQLEGTADNNVINWYVSFARTHLVIGYCPTSHLASTFAKVRDGKLAWWKALLSPGLKFGRTDPNTDPKGYRTVMSFSLAEKLYYKKVKGFPKNFSKDVLGTIANPDTTGVNSTSSQVFPEATLVSQVTTCNLDAGVFYLPEARAAHLPYFRLPISIAYGATAKKYLKLFASERYTNDAGITYAGSPATYTMTIPSTVQNEAGAVAFVKFALSHQAVVDENAIGLQQVAHIIYGNKKDVPPGIN